MKIYAVLINYATPQMTIECVNNLLNQTYKDFNIVVVDNASPDNSFELLQSCESNRCHIIKAEENNGFSAGNNIGLHYALDNGAEKVLFINNDTESDKELVEKLSFLCDKNTVTIPKTYYYYDKTLLWDTGFCVTKFGKYYNRGIGERDKGQYDKQEAVPLLSGHCLMVHKDTIETVGEWDERYFMYHEDTDYAFRMRQKGVNILYVPEAKLWHKVGFSGGGNKNPRMMYYTVRNRLLLNKEYKVPAIWRARNIIWIASLICRYILMRKDEFRYAFLAVKDYKNGKYGKKKFS